MYNNGKKCIPSKMIYNIMKKLLTVSLQFLGFLGSQPNKMKESGITVFGHEYCLANSYFENKDLNEEVEFWKVS